jgi:hypothetical protein
MQIKNGTQFRAAARKKPYLIYKAECGCVCMFQNGLIFARREIINFGQFFWWKLKKQIFGLLF